MTVFDVFDAGLSQTRGLTLYELAKAQLVKLNYLSETEERRKKHLQSCISETCPPKEVNDVLLNETMKLMEEIPMTIEEALRCLEFEISESHGGKARKRLLEIKNQVLF